jgi:hypothetical protein
MKNNDILILLSTQKLSDIQTYPVSEDVQMWEKTKVYLQTGAILLVNCQTCFRIFYVLCSDKTDEHNIKL